MPKDTGDPKGRWEKQRAGGFAENLAYQLLLKFSVERSAAVYGQRSDLLRLLPGKVPDLIQHGLTHTIIMENDTAGALVNSDLPDPWLSLEPRRQKISLSKAHLLLSNPEPDAAATFM